VKFIKILLPALFILLIAFASELSDKAASVQRPSRGIASVDENDSTSSISEPSELSDTQETPSTSPGTQAMSTAISGAARASVTKYMTPQDFIASLTQITDARPSSLSNVSVSFVSEDSIYWANGVNYNLGGTTAVQTAKIRKLILAEFQLYPTACLQRLGLRNLITSADVNIAQDGTLQERTATLDAPNGIMTYADSLIIDRPRNIYLDYLDNAERIRGLEAEGRTDPEFTRYLAGERRSLETRRLNGLQSLRAVINNIHHEFFHYWDIRDDNNLSPDPAWSALNPANFQYGAGGRFARGPEVINWTTTNPGFLNGYSLAGVDEDKAEIWGALMAHSSELQTRMSSDPVIARKVELIKQRAQSFCPEVNASFWQRVQNTNGARIEFLGRLMQATDEAAAEMTVPSF
jgi:hypothetical protein